MYLPINLRDTKYHRTAKTNFYITTSSQCFIRLPNLQTLQPDLTSLLPSAVKSPRHTTREKRKVKYFFFVVESIKPWGVEVQLHSFLKSALDGGEQPASGLRGRIPVQHWLIWALSELSIGLGVSSLFTRRWKQSRFPRHCIPLKIKMMGEVHKMKSV